MTRVDSGAVPLPAERGVPTHMTMTGVRELLGYFPIDYHAARTLVPSRYLVRTAPDGHARLVLYIQDCDELTVDGLLPIRPMRMANLWIELDGPAEQLPPEPGTTYALPTSYWYALPHQTVSRLAALGFTAIGVDRQSVEAISLGGRPGQQRSGHVLENSATGAGYSCVETTPAWPTPRLTTGRRWFYHEHGRLLPRRAVGHVVCRAGFLGEGQIELHATHDALPSRLGLGTQLHGTTHTVQMHCRVTIRVAPIGMRGAPRCPAL